MLNRLFWALNKNFEEVVCAAGLLTMASCIMLQVILRYFFSAAAAWAEEVAVYSMVTSVYLGASLAIKERAHMRITIIINMLPARARAAVLALADLVWFGFLIYLLTLSLSWIKLLFNQTYITPGLGIEQRWPQSIVPFALVLMMLRLIQVYYRWFKRGEEVAPL